MAPVDTLAAVRKIADEVVCLQVLPLFQAVGQFYQYFDKVDDDEVVKEVQQTKRSLPP